MRRILVTQCPSERKAPGNSFGPITISATMPMSRSSPQPMSNMSVAPRRAGSHDGACVGELPPGAVVGSADLAVVRRRGSGDRGGARRRRRHRLMVNGLGVGLDRLVGLVLVRKTLLERLDALGEVAHQLGNLAATAEQQEHDGSRDDPVPNAQ